MSLIRCSRCHEEKPATAFNVDPSRNSGRHPYCTPCKTAPYARPEGWKTYCDAIRTRTEKPCRGCLITKPLADFHNRTKALDKHGSYCKPCALQAAAKSRRPDLAKLRYEANRSLLASKSKATRDAAKLALINLVGGRCVDCGIEPGAEWPLACFDFHHPVRDMKAGVVAWMLAKKNRSAAIEEARKCVVLCANCHRRRHAQGEVK